MPFVSQRAVKGMGPKRVFSPVTLLDRPRSGYRNDFLSAVQGTLQGVSNRCALNLTVRPGGWSLRRSVGLSREKFCDNPLKERREQENGDERLVGTEQVEVLTVGANL